MLPDRVSNPGPLTYESGALPIALRGPLLFGRASAPCKETVSHKSSLPSKICLKSREVYFAGSQLLKERICPYRSNFIPLRVDQAEQILSLTVYFFFGKRYHPAKTQ